jgi:hypothetical protein
MIHSVDEMLTILRSLITFNRKHGKTTNIIIRDDGVKSRIGERTIEPTLIIETEKIKWE